MYMLHVNSFCSKHILLL